MDSNEEISDEDFIRLAEENQIYYNDSLGSRMWDDIAKSDIYLLKQKIGYATYGRSEAIPDKSNYFTGHNIKNLEKITEIANQIIAVSDYDPIRFACIFLTIYYDKKISNVPVFRIHNSGEIIFIDFEKRVYNNWNEFIENNQLPECKYCHPSEGIYFGSMTSFQFQESPACKLLHKTANYTDMAATVTGLGGALASLFIASPVIVPLMATVGTYSVGRSIFSLYDRNNHKQSLNISDKDARSAYINIASSAIAAGSASAVNSAINLVEGGQMLSNYAQYGLKALGATTLAFSGYGCYENIILCTEKFNERTLTPQDVFHFSCEVIFFCNAISSLKATNTMLNKMTEISKMKTRLSNEMRETSTSRPTRFNFFNNIGCSILLGYSPCIEVKVHKYRSVGHDMQRFIKNEIGFKELINSVLPKFMEFSRDTIEDVKHAVTTIQKHFTLFNDLIIYLSNSASSNQLRLFSLQIKNISDRIESTIESNQMTENEEDENVVENNEELIPEVFNLVNGVADITRSHSNLFPCTNLDDFNNILTVFTDEIMKGYSIEIDKYNGSVNTARIGNTNFNITEFNQILGCGTNPSHYFFKEELKKINQVGFLTSVIGKFRARSGNIPCIEICPGNKDMVMMSDMGELTKEQITVKVICRMMVEKSELYKPKFIIEYDGRTVGLEGAVKLGLFVPVDDKKDDYIGFFSYYNENITTGYMFLY